MLLLYPATLVLISVTGPAWAAALEAGSVLVAGIVLLLRMFHDGWTG